MTDEAKALVERTKTVISELYLHLVANDQLLKSMLDLIETQARENERLKDVLREVLNENDALMDITWIKRARAALGASHD